MKIVIITFIFLLLLGTISSLNKPYLVNNINSVEDINQLNNNFKIINNTFDDIYFKIQKPENIAIYSSTPIVSDLGNGELVLYYSSNTYGIAIKMNNTIKYFFAE